MQVYVATGNNYKVPAEYTECQLQRSTTVDECGLPDNYASLLQAFPHVCKVNVISIMIGLTLVFAQIKHGCPRVLVSVLKCSPAVHCEAPHPACYLPLLVPQGLAMHAKIF